MSGLSVSESWKKVLASYTPEKRRWDHTYPWLAYILRPMSFVVTTVLLPLGITANQVTFLTLVLGVLACGGLMTGRPTSMLFGAACLVLLNLFDCVDGNLARINKPTPQGRFYDGMVGYIFPLSYFFMGVGLAYHPDAFWASFSGDAGQALSPGILFLGASSTITRMLTSSTRHTFLWALGDLWESTKKTTTPAEPAASHTGRWYYKLYYNVFDLQSHEFLIFIFILFQAGSLFLLVSALLGLVELLFQLALSLRRAMSLSQG